MRRGGGAALTEQAACVTHDVPFRVCVRTATPPLEPTHLVHGQAHCCRLLTQQPAAHSVHGYPVKPLVDCGQQANHLHIRPLPQQMQCVGTVLAAAPGEPESFADRLLLLLMTSAAHY